MTREEVVGKPAAKEPPGEPSARLRRRTITLLLLFPLFMCLGICGMMFGGFVPTPLGSTTGYVAFFGGGLLGIAAFVLVVLKLLPPTTIREWLLTRLPGFLCFGLIIGFFTYVTFGISLLWGFTAIFGEPKEMVVTVADWRTGGRFNCEGPSLVEAPLFPTVCLDYSWKARLPAGTKLVLAGRGSAFGINVSGVRLP